MAPSHGIGFKAESATHRYAWVAHQNVFVELAPEQFVDPADHAGIAAVEFAAVDRERGVQALAR